MHNKFRGAGQAWFRPLRKLQVILSGLRFAVVYDFNVAYKVVVSFVVLGLCIFFRNELDVLIVLVATGGMVIAEMFNTAIEALCDIVEPRQDERIRIIKDICAAATGISSFVWAVVVVVELGGLWRSLS